MKIKKTLFSTSLELSDEEFDQLFNFDKYSPAFCKLKKKAILNLLVDFLRAIKRG